MSNSDKVDYCKQCGKSYLVKMIQRDFCDYFCSFSCMELYDEEMNKKETNEERISKLEIEVESLKKKLELCLEKLGLNDYSETNSDSDQ